MDSFIILLFQDTTKCNNLIPFYECLCKTGFSKIIEQDLSCQDIDECSIGTHNCDWDNGSCENTLGSFVCHCNTGWKLNGPTMSPATQSVVETAMNTTKHEKCIDIDECSVELNRKYSSQHKTSISIKS